MNNGDPIRSGDTRAHRRIPLRILGLVALFLLCFGHIHQGTLGPDGVRYAHIAHTILERHDGWQLWDEFKDAPYANKPPLLFWLTAGAFDTLGFSTFAARLVPVSLVFVALLALYRLTRRRFDELTALLAVALFSLNAEFFRAVLDLNFEGFIILGGVLILGELLELTKSKSNPVLFGLGVTLLLLSKPPFVVIISGILFLLLLDRRQLPNSSLLLALSLPIFSYCLFMKVQSSAVRAVALENQLHQPFLMVHSWLTNFQKWLKIIFLYYAPLTWLSLWSVWRSRSGPQVRPGERLLWLWVMPLIPIVLTVDVRGPYLLLSMIGLSIIAAAELRRYFAQRYGEDVVRARLGLALRVGIIVLILPAFGIRFHGDDEFQRFFVSQPRYLPELFDGNQRLAKNLQTRVCVDGNDGLPSMPRLKRVQMLLELHHGNRVQVFTSATLPLETEALMLPLIANEPCQHNLEKRGVQLALLDRTKTVAAFRVVGAPASALAAQKTYAQFKADFGPYD